MDLTASQWIARDGKALPFKHWPGAPAKPRGVLICVHGLSGAAQDFWPVGESLPQKGYAVYGMQLRGQGNDPDMKCRGDIRGASQWRHDLLEFTALVHQQHPGVPVFWFGESLGALITIDAAAAVDGKMPATISGLILASPVVALRENLKLPFWKNLLLRTAMFILPRKRISLEAMGNSEVKVTSHTTHRQQMEHTAHYVRDFTVRLFGQVEKLIHGSTAAAQCIHVPVLVLYTPNDALTPREGVESFIRHLSAPDKTPVFFPNGYHLILHDRDREEALRRLEDWLAWHSPAKE